MRFIVLVKATRDSEKGVMPSEKLLAEMGAYHEEAGHARRAGRRLRACSHSSRAGASSTRRAAWSFVDGPFAETRELVAGYTIINVKSREEAIQWTRRFPNPATDGGEAEIEVPPVLRARGLRRQRPDRVASASWKKQKEEVAMFKMIAIAAVLVVGGVLIAASTGRTTSACSAAPASRLSPEKIFPHINNLQAFNAWNPFNKKARTSRAATAAPPRPQARPTPSRATARSAAAASRSPDSRPASRSG